MKKYMLLGTLIAIIPNCVFGESARYRQLVAEKQQKMDELEKCTGNVKGWKIAGISTLGLTAVGIAGNIVLANKQSQYNDKIASADKQIASTKQSIEKKEQEISAREEATRRESACVQSGGNYSSGYCVCGTGKKTQGGICVDDVPVVITTAPVSNQPQPTPEQPQQPSGQPQQPSTPAQPQTTPEQPQPAPDPVQPQPAPTPVQPQPTPTPTPVQPDGTRKTCSYLGQNYEVQANFRLACSNAMANKERLTGGKDCNCTCSVDGTWRCEIDSCDETRYTLVKEGPALYGQCKEKKNNNANKSGYYGWENNNKNLSPMEMQRQNNGVASSFVGDGSMASQPVTPTKPSNKSAGNSGGSNQSSANNANNLKAYQSPDDKCLEQLKGKDKNVQTARMSGSRCEVTSCKSPFVPSDDKQGCKSSQNLMNNYNNAQKSTNKTGGGAPVFNNGVASSLFGG